MIFAREVSDSLASLVKKIDAETAKNSKAKMGSFVVFLSDDEKLESAVKSLADRQGLKNIVLSIDNVAGPKGYNVSKDADITVVLYKENVVKANHTFAKGKLTEKDIEKVSADIAKLVK